MDKQTLDLINFLEWLDGDQHLIKKPRTTDRRSHQDLASQYLAQKPEPGISIPGIGGKRVDGSFSLRG